MGYEGHVVGLDDRAERASTQTEDGDAAAPRAPTPTSAASSSRAAAPAPYDINTWVTEIQAGSYALMDTAYGRLDLPFRPALALVATVISVSDGWAVADCGLKSLGMDHGEPGDRRALGVVLLRRARDVRVPIVRSRSVTAYGCCPAHVDPTVACHERMHLVDGDEVGHVWPVDLRGW